MPSSDSNLKNSSTFSSLASLAIGNIASKISTSKSSDSLSSGITKSIPSDRRDEIWGRPGPMYGLMGYNVLIDAPLEEKICSLFYKWGPNSLLQFQATNVETADLQIPLQCYYHPKNADGHWVRNLASSEGKHDASLTGRTRGAIVGCSRFNKATLK